MKSLELMNRLIKSPELVTNYELVTGLVAATFEYEECEQFYKEALKEVNDKANKYRKTVMKN